MIFSKAFFTDISAKHLTILVIALGQVIFGIVTLISNETIFNNLLNSVSDILVKFYQNNVCVLQQLVVTRGTRAFQAWSESPVPAYTKFYFFNMLNAEDFIKNNVKPIVEERGPYTFRYLL